MAEFESDFYKEQADGDGEKDPYAADLAAVDGIDGPDLMSTSDEDEGKKLSPSTSEEDQESGLY